MDGMLSQEEINALLNSISSDDIDAARVSKDETSYSLNEQELTLEEKDAIGEISNISLGTSATTLSQLVNQRVLITTPKVELTTWSELQSQFANPCVYIQISYKEGLDGNNILVLKEEDVMVIADLMMGGDGKNVEGEVTDLHLSAISEAMNQMMGSASTSLSSMIEKTVDISPPEARRVSQGEPLELMYPQWEEPFINVSFKIVIGDLVDSEMMQLYSLKFARDLYQKFCNNRFVGQEQTAEPEVQVPDRERSTQSMDMGTNAQPMMGQPMNMGMNSPSMMEQPMNVQPYMQQEINVAPAQFQPFNTQMNPTGQQENIDLIMDVPLEVTVELGRTNKSIKEILEFAPGTIIELNKLAGEPVDVLVNGKQVAKGEVVVIEESFGIRVTEILNR